ncbi:4-alpha-glucanotransferase [Actinopolymorpha rutila]|uniref:4-alpha-glucanotransferase n=1 Tax=Actinopolymorpha rutila TaxID=446787 RepID=A0A852ZTM0_9ACTN|nr:4-alpha-glucanotransferase [Actinopolymorpha rutila]NYH91986.1 4-alpha-glucanotransferase [Actinopolymorpha rutila]
MPDAWGIESRYVDATDKEQQVPPEVVERLREIIGTPTDDAGPLIVGEGEQTHTGPGEVVLEDGRTVPVKTTTPADLPLGYHTFVDRSGSERRLIVTPGRCHLPEGWRAWGWATQLYATRSAQSWGMGDLADLGQLARWSRQRGAGFLLVNPIGAVAPSLPQQPSPYFPASRRFRNPLYLRVEDVPGAELAADDVRRAATAGRALNDRRTIDRDTVWELKQSALEAIWSAGGGSTEFDRWYADQPASLRQFATWSVLVEQHGADWQEWPAELARPQGPAVTEAEEKNADRVRFHAWLQWLVEGQLAAAGRDLAVMQDLPIGFDPHGFDAWEWQDLVALDASVGAPPDEFNQLGQDWGLPPFIPWRLRAAGYQPFIDTIRSSMSAGGGLRVDHVMGLFRLWWIPDDSGPAGGAYVRYPTRDLLSLVALESTRAGAAVVGEDLGTVEEGVREELAERDILSYRLLWFEEDDPTTWPAKSMAAVTTHDLPTVAGLWDGSDLDTQRRLGQQPNEESTAAIRHRLAKTGGLDDHADSDAAVVAAYELLARAPATLLTATLDDAVVEPERPNMPGADEDRDNWSLALPATLEDLESHPTGDRIAEILSAGVGDAAATPGTQEPNAPR